MTPILIPIKQDKPGFEHFIGSWVFKADPTVVVDVGPSRSIGLLLQALYDLGIKQVDFVLLTHIHIDHAGGLAEFLNHFPMARAICHDKAVKHLVDPTNLWLGTQKALGDLAVTYGPITPVDKQRLIPHRDARVPGLEVIETPGHAPHHLSFAFHGNLFAGEAAGVYLALENSEYLRPATPPVFFLKEFLESIDRLLLQGDLPILYSHFGKADRSRTMLKRSRDQLLFWERIVSEEPAGGGHDLHERCVKRLLKEDLELKAFQGMEPEVQAREKFFLTNSVKGYLGYLKDPSGQLLQQRS